MLAVTVTFVIAMSGTLIIFKVDEWDEAGAMLVGLLLPSFAVVRPPA